MTARDYCPADLAGCTQEPAFRIYCRNENINIEVCGSCAQVWRENAQSSSLYDRCPRCALWRPGTRTLTSLAVPAPLAGAAGLVLDAAMHAEGLRQEVRHRVLRRLAAEAAWLGLSEPPGPPPPGRLTWPGSVRK